MSKKILLLVICALFLFAGTACTTNTPAQTSQAATSQPATSQAAEPSINASDIKIGVNFYNWTIPIAADAKRMIDAAADALGCQVEYASDEGNSETSVTNVQNLFASGCKAVIICNWSDDLMPKLCDIAEQYDGKIFQFFRTIANEEDKNYCWASKGYGGQVHEDEYNVGYTMGTILAEKGVKNVGLTNFTPGDATAEARQKGYIDALTEKGVNILAKTWNIQTSEQGAQCANNYMTSYPEMDGIVVVGGGGEPMFGVQSAIKNAGKIGKIQVVTTDFYPNQTPDLQSGALSAISGGHWCDPFFSFMTAYNWAAGGLNDKVPLELPLNMMYIQSADDSTAFDKWFVQSNPYNKEEIQAMSCLLNPNWSYDTSVKEVAQKLSIQDVISRHSK